MGISGIGFTELLMILLIVVLLFGTKKLGSLGSDLGAAIRGFRRAVSGDSHESPAAAAPPAEPGPFPGPAAGPAAGPTAGPAAGPTAGPVPAAGRPVEPPRP